jgi:topoisomerase-4 subunit A
MGDGTMMVTKVDSKTFVGKNIIHVAVFKKKDKRTIYNLMYRDGTKGNTYMKRFAVTSITRDREYSVGKDKPGTKVYYFSANPNGEAEKVTVYLRQIGNIKKLKFEADFAEQLIKGRSAKGNIVSKHAVKKVELKEEGVSTLKPRKIWFDDTVQRLNVEGRGDLLGEFRGEDKLLLVTQDGIAKTITPELTLRFDENYIIMQKWDPKRPITAIYWEGERERYYVKRFLIENAEKEELIITEHSKSQLELVTTDLLPVLEIIYRKQRNKEQKPNDEVNLEEFIAVKGIKAQGNQLTTEKITQLNFLDPIVPEVEESEEEAKSEENQDDEKSDNNKGESQGSLFD